MCRLEIAWEMIFSWTMIEALGLARPLEGVRGVVSGSGDMLVGVLRKVILGLDLGGVVFTVGRVWLGLARAVPPLKDLELECKEPFGLRAWSSEALAARLSLRSSSSMTDIACRLVLRP